mgnify:CR=1 FL=1
MRGLLKKTSALVLSFVMSMSGCMTSISAQTTSSSVTTDVAVQSTTQKSVQPKVLTKQSRIKTSSLVKAQSKASVEDPGCYISDFGIKKMTDGTPAFDKDDNPGNDSSKSNKIVRSFDYVNYDLEYVTAITDKTKVVNEAYVGIEFSLDKDPSKAVFNKDSFAWCENPVTTYYYEDGTNSTKWDQKRTVVKQVLTGRRKITNNADTNAIPGIGTLSFGVYVKGEINGAIIQPEFKCWIEGNDKVKATQSEPVTVSAEPRYNLRLVRNTSSQNSDPLVYVSPDRTTLSTEDKDGYLTGRMESYNVQLELLNESADKALKGIELPAGNITFDLKATEKVDDKDVTGQEGYAPFLWDYNVANSSSKGVGGKDFDLIGDSRIYLNTALPYGTSKRYSRSKNSTWDSGEYSIIDKGNGNMSVSLDNYSFDLDQFYFPTYTAWADQRYSPNISKNQNIFSIGYMQVFCQFPREVDTTTNLKMFMEASNFKATSAGGQAVNTEVRTVDNITSNVITLYPRGSFTSFQLYNNCSSWAAPDGTASAGEFLTSGKRQYSTGYIYYQGDVLLTNWNFLYKFDDTVFEPTGEDIGVGHGYTSVNVKAETSTCLYAAKPDKTGWKSDEEQTKAKEEDLIYFKSYKELKDAGYTCVGFLEEVRKGKYSEVYLRFGLKVRDDAKPGSVGMTTHCTKGWIGKDKVGSWTEYSYKNNQNIYGTGDGSTANGKIYRSPNYSVHSNYTKAVYEEGTIIKGHTNGHIAGQSLLITGDRTQISIAPADGKSYYDVDNGERTTTFKLTPSLKVTSANSSTTDSEQYDNVYITATLPKDLHYNVGTASKEPDSVKENDNGTTTIKWTLKNQKVGGVIDPITFDCKIGAAGTKNDVENNQQIQAQAKISSDQDKRKCTTDYGNLSKTTINIIKLATSSIAKTVDKELNEVGAPFKFTLNMGNTSEIDVKQARLYDVMPFNGDERGSNYHGKYRITSVTLDYKDAPKTFEANKNNAYIQTTTDTKYQTNPDYNNILNYTGLDAWDKLTNGVVNEDKKTITFAVNTNDITALFMDFGGDLVGNEFIKAHIQCSPADMNGKLITADDGSVQIAKDMYVNSFYEYATNQIAVVQSNIVKTTVKDRMISGRLWIDKNKDGIQSFDEESMAGKKVALYRTTPSNVGADKGSVTVAGKTLYPAYTTTGDKINPSTTGERGEYEFHQLEAGTYVTVINDGIMAYTVTGKKQGTDTDIDSDATAGDMKDDRPLNALSDEINLVDSWTSEHNDFGFYRTVAPQTTLKKVWEDDNDSEGFRPLVIDVDITGSDGSSKTVRLSAAENWSKAVGDLSKYTDDGKEVKYTFAEKENGNYTGKAEIQSGRIVFTNTKTVEKKTISVKKVWDDDNNRDKVRPREITVQLLGNGKVIQEYDGLGEGDGWSYTFDPVNRFKDGKEVEYTVREKDTPQGYTASYTKDGNSWTITNSHTPEKTEVTVNKVWNDSENQDGIRPDSIKAELYANDKKVQEFILDSNDGWTKTFSNLNKNENGKAIQYEIREVSEVKGYTSAVSNKGNAWTITNTHKTSKTSVSGTKTWNDDENRDGIRPDSVTVRLYANNKEVAHKSVNAQSGWKYEFTDLDEFKAGQKIIYTVSEDTVEGYTTSYDKFNLFNTHDINKLSVSVRKAWDDNENQDGIRPESVTVRLYKNGAATDKTLTLSDKNGWQASFTDLFEKENGVNIDYTVQEENVPSGYTASVKKDDNGIFVITNSHTPALTSVFVTKSWNDDNNRDAMRPDNIFVTLYGNGDEVAKKTISKDMNWEYIFNNLPAYSHGKRVVYTAVEDEVIPYTSETVQNENNIQLINSYEPVKMCLKIRKDWDDKDDVDKIRPESVTIHLLSNGTDIGTYEITKDNDWELEIPDLFIYENGQQIEYSVTEDDVDGYTSKIVDMHKVSEDENEDNKDDNDDEEIETYSMAGPEFDFVITNTHTPKPEPKPEITPQKPSKQDPPAKITVKASEIPTGVQSGEAFWLILFCACFTVCVLMLMEQGVKKRKK